MSALHPSGYHLRNVSTLRWIAAQPVPPLADDMPEAARLALDGLVLNRFVAAHDGQPIPVGYGVGVRFVVSPEGRRVLRAADRADAIPAPPDAPGEEAAWRRAHA